VAVISRQQIHPEIAFLHTVRIFALSSAFGTVAFAGIALWITPGSSFSFSDNVFVTPLMKSPDPPLVEPSGSAHLIGTQSGIANSLDYPQTIMPGPASGAPAALVDKPCEQELWSSLKGKCLSFASRRKHRGNLRFLTVGAAPLAVGS